MVECHSLRINGEFAFLFTDGESWWCGLETPDGLACTPKRNTSQEAKTDFVGVILLKALLEKPCAPEPVAEADDEDFIPGFLASMAIALIAIVIVAGYVWAGGMF